MKTKGMITLLAAMMLGIIVNAQSYITDTRSAQEKVQEDFLKMMVMEYGSDLSDLFSQLTDEQEEAVKTMTDKCTSGLEYSNSCTIAIKKSAKLFPFFQHFPDGEEDQSERAR